MKIPHDILALRSKVEDQVNNSEISTAIQTQLDVLTKAQSFGHPKILAVCYQHLGELLNANKDIQRALYAYESAFKALNQEDHRFDKTIKSLRRVRKGFDRNRKISIPDSFKPSVANSLEHAIADEGLALKLLIQIGNSYFDQPQIAPALNIYQQILQQQNISAYPILQAQTFVKIGEIFRQQKQYLQAQETNEKAIAIFENKGSASDSRFAISLKARLLYAKGKQQQAIAVYEKAISLFKEAKDEINVKLIYTQLGQLYLGINDFKNAKRYYKLASINNNSIAWHVHWGLGCCVAQEQNWKKAVQHFEKSLDQILTRQNRLYTDEGKVAFLESTKDVFDQLISAYIEMGDLNSIKKALETVEKSKGQSLDDLMMGKKRYSRKAKAKVHPTQLDPNSPIQQMSSGTQVPPTDEFSFPNDVSNLPDFSDMIRQEARSVPVDSFANQMAPSFDLNNTNNNQSEQKGSKEKILPNRNYLIYYQLKDRMLIWLKKSNGTIQFQTSTLEANKIAQLVQSFRVAMINDAKNRGLEITRNVQPKDEKRGVIFRRPTVDVDYNKLTHELYAAILSPIENELTDIESLVIIPDESLWLLPFAALNSSTQPFGSRFYIHYSPSIKALEQIDQDDTLDKGFEPLIIGNPKMSEQHPTFRFEQLEGAEKEAKEIAQLFNTKPLLHKDAHIHAIEQVVEKTNILHLATHGIADEKNPLDSFVVLADSHHADGNLSQSGFLKARDIMNWSISCDLVNLSACQTALGKIAGEGIIGLSRAFLVAGSQSVLVSLWNISDVATALFEIAFYKNFIQTKNKAIALHQAMQFMQQHPQYNHPVYWSGFVLVGTEF